MGLAAMFLRIGKVFVACHTAGSLCMNMYVYCSSEILTNIVCLKLTI